MDINNKRPEDVLKPEFVQTYEELHKDIWGRLINVNTNLTILEKIQSFPFHHIYAPQENIFWTMVYWNFLYISITSLHGLTTDEGEQKHTLLRFKNRLLKDWIKESEKERYRKKLKSAKLDKNLRAVRSKITEMRHKVIAHRLLDSDRHHLIHVEGVTLTELSQVCQDLETLFHDCSFGAEYISNFYVGGTVGGKPIEKDIDKLLDLIVKDSYWLNEPEEKAQFWPELRKLMSKEEVTELNEFRKKFGMPPA